jgi:hypothetical protein
LNPIEKRGLKPLIVLTVYVFCDRMTSRIGRGNRQHQSNGEIRPNACLHPRRAGMKKGSGLRRLFGNFKGNLRRQMERGRQDGGTSPVCLRKPRCPDKLLIGIAIRLHQLAKPPANLTQPVFRSSLPAEARAHDPQRGREGAHQGSDRAAGRNRGRRSHRVKKVR